MQPAAQLSVLVTAQTNPAVRGLLRVQTQLTATESSANKALGAVKTLAKGSALAAGGGLAYAVKKAADFESQLSSLGSVSDATGRQMEQFRRQAIKAGADTKFSALDAARAQTELAKGGLSVRQIMKGGLRSALALAAAGELDLGEAAETTANALKLFGLTGRESMRVADALATAANKTTADVSDFAVALKQGGSVAKLAGLDLQQTVTILEALAEAGIKNSDAGTSLKAFFLNIATPSKQAAAAMQSLGVELFDTQGNLKSLPGIARNLRQAFGDLTREQFLQKAGTIAGSDAIRTLYSLYAAGPSKLRGFEQGLRKQGTAAQVAAEKQNNLKGALENLQGSVETIAIQVGSKLLPGLTAAARQVTEILNNPHLTTAQKFDQLGEMAAKAIGDAGPVVAEAAAKLGVVGVRGFFNAFRESPLWLKLLTGGFLFAKFGGLQGIWTQAGRRAGVAMATGVAEGATAASGGALGGLTRKGGFGRLAGAFGILGRRVVGVALVAGIADALSREDIRNKDRFTEFASFLSAGLIPEPDTISSKFRESLNEALRGNWVNDFKNSPTARDFEGFLGKLLTADKGFDKRQADLIRRLSHVRSEAMRLFGPGTTLTAKVAVDTGDAIKRLRAVWRQSNDLKQGFIFNLRDLRKATATNFKAVSDLIGVHTQTGRRLLSENFQAGFNAIRRFMADGKLTTRQGMREIARLLKVYSGDGATAIRGNMSDVFHAIRNTMTRAERTSAKGMSLIRDLFVKELRMYGLSPRQALAGANVRTGEVPGGFRRQDFARQRGGLIPGVGDGDKVHVMAEPGEGFINKKAVRALGGPAAIDAINRAVPRFQGGGIVALGHRLQRMGYEVGEHPGFGGVAPVHVPNSYHYKGQALDVNDDVPPYASGGGEPGSLDRLYSMLKGKPGVVELLWRVANHFDHLHVAMAGEGGPLGALGRAAKKLAQIKVDGADSPLRSIVQATLDKTRASAQRRLNKLAASVGVEGSEPGQLGLGVVRGNGSALMKKISKQYGWNFADWWEVDRRESSHGTNLVNPNSTARLRGQFLDFNWGKYGPGSDPRQNPTMAQQIWSMAAYIKERYGNPSKALAWHDAHNWYAKGGVVGYAGDSLGVGTLGPLRQLLDRKVEGHPSTGKTSSWGVGQLIKGAAQHVFDFGTNDATAAAIRNSINRVDNITGKKPIHVLTVNGTPAGGESVELKNRAIRGVANGDVRLIDWASKHKGQLDELGHGAYGERARLIAASIRQATKAEGKDKKDGKEPKVGKPFGGPLGKVLTKTLKVLRSSKSAKVRGERLRQFEKRVRKFGLPKRLNDQLALLSSSASVIGDKADRAGQLNLNNEDGTTTLGVFQGKDEGGWLNDQLAVLLQWRNRLIDAIAIIEKRRKEVAKLLERARKRLQEVANQIRFAAQVRRQVSHDLDVAKKHPKKNKRQIRGLKDLLKRLDSEQEPRVRERKLLKGRIIPALDGRRGALVRQYGDLLGPDGLEGVQGAGGPLERFRTLPPLGVLGGSIFDVQLRLRDLAAPTTSAADNSPVTDTESVEILKQLLKEANLRTAVAESHFKIFRDFDASPLQQFATGGIVEAPIGAPVPVIAHGGEGVFTREQMAAMGGEGGFPEPVINVTVVVQDGAVDKNKIRAEVESTFRGRAFKAAVASARLGGRSPLPGRGGGI